MAVFLEVIEWFDETGRTMMQRIPEQGSAEIKFGAQLIVRESQAAIFFSGRQSLRHPWTRPAYPVDSESALDNQGPELTFWL